MSPRRPIPPSAFEATANCAHMYLESDSEYNWRGVTPRSAIPTGKPCVVVCRVQGMSEARCLAFAVRDRGHVTWFGVTHCLQSPEELHGVRGYVTVEEIDEAVRDHIG